MNVSKNPITNALLDLVEVELDSYDRLDGRKVSEPYPDLVVETVLLAQVINCAICFSGIEGSVVATIENRYEFNQFKVILGDTGSEVKFTIDPKGLVHYSVIGKFIQGGLT